MGIARYRDAKTGELIENLSEHEGEYVVERPVGTNGFGEPMWADEVPVNIYMSQETAKKLLVKIRDDPEMLGIAGLLEAQIWKFDRKQYV